MARRRIAVGAVLAMGASGLVALALPAAAAGIANNDAYTAPGHTATDALSVAAPGLLANDDPSYLTVANVSAVPGAQGSLTVLPDGSFVFTPSGTYAGLVTFTYNAVDAALATSTATVTITVPNAVPTLSPPSVAPIMLTNLNATTSFPMIIADGDAADVASLALSAKNFTGVLLAANVSVSGTSPNYTVAVTGSGTAGSGTFDLVGSDAVGGTVTVTVAVTIHNAAPTIVAPANVVLGATNATTGPLAVTVADVDTPAVTLTASSDAPGTVTTFANIAARTVTVTGLAGNPVGTVTVTVTANDNVNLPVSSTFTVAFNNAAPVIMTVPDQTVAALNGTTGALAVTITDADTAAGSITLLQATAVPASVGVVVNTAAKTVTVTGDGVATAATITLHATDSITPAAPSTFVVTFANFTPKATLPAPPPVIGYTNSTGTLTVTVADADTIGAVTVMATGPAGVSVSPLVAGVAGATTRGWTFSVAGNLGTSPNVVYPISVTVQDGANTPTTSSFNVSFTNISPTVSTVAPPAAIKVTASTGALPVTVGDTETPAATLTLGATSNNTKIIPLPGGSGSNRTVSVTAAADAPVGATALITLTVTDTSGDAVTNTSSSTFLVTVADTAPSSANTPPILVDQNPGAKQITVTGTDANIEQAALLSAVPSAPANGTVSCSSLVCTYKPNVNFVGVDTFLYQVSDGTLLSPSSTVTLNVGYLCTPLRQGTANPDSITAFAGDVVCAMGGNDSINADAMPDVIIGGPGIDTVTFNTTAGPDIISATENAVTVNGVITKLYNIEHIVINGAAGDDTISVTQVSRIGGIPVLDYTVSGGTGTLDQLRYVTPLGGVDPTVANGTMKEGSLLLVTFSSIENAGFQQALTLGDSGGAVPSADSFTLQYTRPLGSVFDGLGMSDTYNILPGGFVGPMTISDSGTSGTDTANIRGTSGPDVWAIDGERITPSVGSYATYTGIESVNVSPGAGDDNVTFSVDNTGLSKYFFDGGSGSDTLVIDAGQRAATLTRGSSGLTILTIAGLAPIPIIRFESITITNSSSGDQSISSIGYWMVASDGGIFAFGDHKFEGSAGGEHLNSPVVDMSTTPSGRGYTLCAADGSVFNYGDSPYLGSMGATRLNQPIVGCAATPSGHGYWLVAADGGIFSFGDAAFYGSTGGIKLNLPVVGMASTPSGHGYWLVASDGGIFSYGDAAFYGSTGDLRLNQPVVGLSRTVSGKGYWLVARDGGIFAFGDAAFYGSMGGQALNKPIVGIDHTINGSGYWLFASDGGVFSFGDATFYGSTGAFTLNQPMVHGRATGF